MYNASYEDAIFIVNMRIRMVRDTLRLNPPSELFLERSLDDLEFIDKALAFLAKLLAENSEQHDEEGEYDAEHTPSLQGIVDYASDAEWQFSQLLTELSVEFGPFSSIARDETREKITALREASEVRRKALEESALSMEMVKAEPVVSSVELSSLLGGN